MIALVLLIENLLFPLALLVFLLRFALSPRRRALLGIADEVRERLGCPSPEGLASLAGREVLWIHAASAGEMGAAAQLVKSLRRRRPAAALVLTASTAAGRERALTLGADLAVLAPLDCYPAVSRFLSVVKPKSLLILETELWPHMVELSHRRGVAVALVNGRLTQRSFGRYRLLAALTAPFLRRILRIAVQTEGDAERFRSLGADPGSVRVTGNMKFDALAAGTADEEIRGAIKRLGWEGATLLVAGSTHPGEEETVLAAYQACRKAVPGLKIAIAPRHAERAAATARTLRALGIGFSAWSAPQAGGDCLLVDAMGILPRLYALAAASFVGGTLVPVGGHNVLEPALAGSPVLFGPHTFHTEHTARLLESAGCGFRVEGAEDLARTLSSLLADRRRAAALGQLARRTAQGLQGATERTLSFLAEAIPWLR